MYFFLHVCNRDIPLLYSFSLCCTEVMAPSTESLLTRLLMLEAVPNSSANILATLDIWSLGGIISEIILVPLLKKEKKEKAMVNFSQTELKHILNTCMALKFTKF